MLLKDLKAIDENLGAAEKLLFAERGVRVLSVAVWRRRMGDDVGGHRPRQRSIDRQGNTFSAFARPALFGFHLLHRIQVNSGEYKLMGLAPYGEAKYAQTILDHLIEVKADGSFRLNLDYFDYRTGLTMTNSRFSALFGGPERKPDELLTQRHMDIAASIQAITEELALRLTRALATETKMKNLCLAGGVALNCVANGTVLRDGRFDGIWIQPAARDAGGALGAALAAHYHQKGRPRAPSNDRDGMNGPDLGPAFDQFDIERQLSGAGAKFIVLKEDELLDETARALADEKAVGWFQGRMEFGPRALGNRSILGDARSPTMQKMLNLKVKYRESFRPFAPSVLQEDTAEWFEIDGDSPYMLLVAPGNAQCPSASAIYSGSTSLTCCAQTSRL
jgi:carbamoyltransferase